MIANKELLLLALRDAGAGEALRDPEVANALRSPSVAPVLRSVLGPDDRPIPIDEAAAFASVTPRVISDAARRGELVILRAGRERLIERAEFDRWLRSRPTKAKSANDVSADPREAARSAVHAAAARAGRR